MNKFLSNDCWLDAHRGCAEPQDIGHILKNFDLTSKFGPCLGLTRLERRVRLPCCMRGSAMLRAEFAVTQLLNTVHSIHPQDVAMLTYVPEVLRCSKKRIQQG